jgi:nucleoside-diphosphate-sugar epimerase
MTTVLITGVNGFIGSHLAADLAKRGYRIVGSTSSEARLRVDTPNVDHKVVLRLGGPCDVRILQGIDAVIHCAWDLRPGAGQVNIDGTKRLLEAAEQGRVPHQVFISSYSAHDSAVSDYGRAKLVVQKHCLEHGHAVVRPGLVIGPGGMFQRMSDTVARHRVVPLVDGGRAMVPFIGLEDLQLSLATIVERRLTGLFALFSPDRITLKELMLEIRAAAGRRTLLIPVPSGLLLGPVWLMGKLGVTLPIGVDSLKGLHANLKVEDPSDLPTFVPRPLTLASTVRAAALAAPAAR